MPKISRLSVPLVVTAAGLAVTLLAARYVRGREEAAARAETQRRAQAIVGVIGRTLRTHEEVLRSVRNLFDFSEHVSRAEFNGFAGEFLRRHRGIQSLEWAPRVPGDRRAAFEAAVRAEGFPDFEFRARAGGTALRRAPDRAEHFPVAYVQPYAPNRAALGFDLASSSIWPQLEDAARDERAHASRLVSLITDGSTAEDWGYILQLSVYAAPAPGTPATPRERLRGFVIGLFRPRDIIEEAIATLDPQGMDLVAVDHTAPAGRHVIHFHPSRSRTAAAPMPPLDEFRADPFLIRGTAHLANQEWELLMRPVPQLLAAQRGSGGIAVLVGGCLGSMLLGLYLHATLRRSQLVAEQVDERTGELREARRLLEDDIRRREEAEQRLRDSEARLHAILDQSPNAIFVKDLGGRYLLCNGTFASLRGRAPADVVGRTDRDLFPEAVATTLHAHDQQALAFGSALESEETLPLAAGSGTFIFSRFPLLNARSQAYALCGIVTDITGRKSAEHRRLELERQLLESRKLESLGVLAGGIAHDFNNILTAVLGNATLAREAVGSAPARKHLLLIEQAARRAADLCQQMLAYAGQGRVSSAPVDLGEIVRGTASLLGVSLSKKVRLALQLGDDVPAIQADATQLRQIVMNLVLNAADAIGDEPGEVAVRTGRVRATAAELAQGIGRPELPEGDYVFLEVQDTGCGMDAATQARIFEPFFTTKFSGRGLGLSAVLGIVQGHRGSLFVRSIPGAGTTFRLLFPAVAAAPVNGSRPPMPAAGEPLRGRVLVIDDEPSVRQIARVALESQGATVHEAANGDEALEFIRRAGPDLGLVLLDLTMPGLTGEETVHALRRLPGRFPIVLMSGYTESAAARRAGHLDVQGFLHKPFEIDTLLAEVRAHLR
ncbi:MAG TPA: CHASE domain-containing protein [Opitutaceae bacterium]|nr:CHASE domain-containing protein [Opitutaceae bacterium]